MLFRCEAFAGWGVKAKSLVQEAKWADHTCEKAYGYVCKKRASIKPSGGAQGETNRGCKLVRLRCSFQWNKDRRHLCAFLLLLLLIFEGLHQIWIFLLRHRSRGKNIWWGQASVLRHRWPPSGCDQQVKKKKKSFIICESHILWNHNTLKGKRIGTSSKSESYIRIKDLVTMISESIMIND